MKALLIIIALSYSLTGFSQYYQNGFKLIRKAQRYESKGNLKKALFVLKQAEQASYGFCGNAWESGLGWVHHLKAGIYIKQGNYWRALREYEVVGDCSLGGDCSYTDSLKVAMLIKIYGKQKVTQDFRRRYNDSIDLDTIHWSRNLCIHLDSVAYKFCLGEMRSKLGDKKKWRLIEIFQMARFHAILEDE